MSTKKKGNTLFKYFSTINPPPKRSVLHSNSLNDVDTASSQSCENKRPHSASDSSSNEDADESGRLNKRQKLASVLQPSSNDSRGVVTSTQQKPCTKFVSIDLETKEENEGAEIVHEHTKFEFLKQGNIKDSKGRKYNDPKYDGRTLYVPESFLSKLSPAFRQWWDLKSRYFDCVLLFKVGKFYEFYHMDADIAVKILECTYMKGEFAHCGFPEISCAKMAALLVKAGYKVARVEQTETIEAMAKRCKFQRTSKFEKVVKRELCRITNRGTQIPGVQCDFEGDHKPNFMLAVVRKVLHGEAKYGICLVETSFGELKLGQFDDNRNFSRLRTLLYQYPPVLILYDKRNIPNELANILKTITYDADIETVPECVDVMDSEKTLKDLTEKYFYKKAIPEALMSMIEENESSKLVLRKGHDACFAALEICLWYWRYCLIDKLIMSMARIEIYTPPDISLRQENISIKKDSRSMILDSITLSNLRLIGDRESLLATLDQCCTKFGKRLLRQWICSPCHDLAQIKDRQIAITEFSKKKSANDIRLFLNTLPDFQRQFSQVQVFGVHLKQWKHPDNRAVLFEEQTYNKKKIQTFIHLLRGLEDLTKIPERFSNFLQSKLITKLSQLPPMGQYPQLKPLLDFFQNAFDHNEALELGFIAPKLGVDVKFDAVEEKIKKINDEMNEYLSQQSTFFSCDVKYVGNDKKRFQLEIPAGCASKATEEYNFEGQKKGEFSLRRYTTSKTKDFLKRMIQLEEDKNSLLKDTANGIFQQFSNYYNVWEKILNCVAELDVLLSLALFSDAQPVCCVPEFFENRGMALLDIQEAYYPLTSFVADFIPNSIKIGNTNDSLLLLTGPNMGGKSTLMRSTAIICVLAHLGCHVPAKSCKLSLIDRIFTRLGAQDDILAGHSTFFVELTETASVITDTTAKSLVLLDELGRGTSTHDGSAVATAVASYLANLGCRSIFSTHYHNLIHYFHQDDRINLGHMSCMVENEDDEDPTQEAVTFLYKLAPGACPKSFGFNAAKLAGMPNIITKRASKVSKACLADNIKRKLFIKILFGTDVASIRKVVKTG